LIITLFAAAGLAVVPAAAASAAQAAPAARTAPASTPGCAAAAGGFCGSQQVTPQPGNVYMMAAPNKAGAFVPVEVKIASGTATTTGTNASEDFTAVNPPNPVDNSKVFKYSPDGVVFTGKGFKSGLCVTAAGPEVDSLVVLEPCTNAVSQQWIFTPEVTGGTWRLRGSSYVLTDPDGKGPYTKLQLRNDWDGPNQQWTAIYPPAAG
jgi:hypothetical protein